MKRHIGSPTAAWLIAVWLITSAFLATLRADTSYLLIQGPFGPGGSAKTYKWAVTYPAGYVATSQDLLNAVLGAPLADGTISDPVFGERAYYTAGNSAQGASYIDFGGGSFFTYSFTLNSVVATTNNSTPSGTSTVGWNYYVAGGSGIFGGAYADTGAWLTADDGQTTRYVSDGSFDGWVFGNTGYDPNGNPATTGSTTSAIDDTSNSNNPSDFMNSGTNDVFMTVTVTPPTPVITSASTASGTEGQLFAYQITATNNPTSYDASGLPGGLAVAPASGLVSGTPTASGTFTASVTATDAGVSGSAGLTIVIAPPAPVITGGSVATGIVGQAFTYQITATNNPTAYGESGLPVWATVSPSSGLISGTPTASGTFSGNISAGNDGGTQTSPLAIVVSPPTGSVTVSLFPAGAITGGAQWNLDGGADQGSGATLGGISLGSHTVNFTTIPGYTAPGSQDITVNYAQTTTVTGTYAAIPVIIVQQPSGAALVNGSSTVNFGIAASGSTAQRTFTILNGGAADLTGIAVDITGTDTQEFKAGAPGTTTVVPSGATTFTITYSPVDIHASAATLRITSNDPVTPSFDVNLAATGTNGPVNLSFAAGTFAGLVDKSGTGAGTAIAGYARLTLTKTGKVTGRLYSGETSQAIRGAFDGNGGFHGKPAGVGLLLSSGSGGETNASGYWMLGSATAPAGLAPFKAWHAAYAHKDPVSETGKYTVLLSATDTSPSIPKGTGYAFASVAKTGGSVRMNGKLSDGTAFSVSSVLVSGPDGRELLVFDPKPYRNKGLFAGSIVFEHLTDSDCDGAMEWMRPATERGALYPQGFDTNADLTGSLYVKPGKGVVLPLFVDGTLTLSDGGLGAPIPQSMAVSPQGLLVVTGTNPADLKISVNVSTGGLSGSFVHPATMKRVSFAGVLYQNASLPSAAGFFVGPILSGTSLSGAMTLSP